MNSMDNSNKQLTANTYTYFMDRVLSFFFCFLCIWLMNTPQLNTKIGFRATTRETKQDKKDAH